MRRSPIAIDLLASLKLGRFSRCHRFNDLVSIRQRAHDIVIQDAHTAGRDCAEREFFKTGHTEFAYNENIERHIQTPRHFVGDRDTASRQTEHDHISTTGIFFELFREEAASFRSV